MFSLSRVGDQNQVGGKIIRGASTVYAEFRPVGLHPSTITPHANFKGPHLRAITLSGSPTVFCEFSPVLRAPSPTSCGHSIVTGCSTVKVI